LLGGLRASAQMISYEIAMGLAVIGVIMVSGSLATNDIILSQAG
jgi:NADH-quinone oxidoreductase subunit H